MPGATSVAGDTCPAAPARNSTNAEASAGPLRSAQTSIATVPVSATVRCEVDFMWSSDVDRCAIAAVRLEIDIEDKLTRTRRKPRALRRWTAGGPDVPSCSQPDQTRLPR